MTLVYYSLLIRIIRLFSYALIIKFILDLLLVTFDFLYKNNGSLLQRIFFKIMQRNAILSQSKYTFPTALCYPKKKLFDRDFLYHQKKLWFICLRDQRTDDSQTVVWEQSLSKWIWITRKIRSLCKYITHIFSVVLFFPDKFKWKIIYIAVDINKNWWWRVFIKTYCTILGRYSQHILIILHAKLKRKSCLN